jgi:hypothetical protein
MNNLCNIQVATQGMSAANIELGEIWIDYDIAFFKKQVPSISDFAPFGKSGVTVAINDRLTKYMVPIFMEQPQLRLPFFMDPTSGVLTSTLGAGSFILLYLINYSSLANFGTRALKLLDEASCTGIDFDDGDDSNPVNVFDCISNCQTYMAARITITGEAPVSIVFSQLIDTTPPVGQGIEGTTNLYIIKVRPDVIII